jgi:hypothetical protein
MSSSFAKLLLQLEGFNLITCNVPLPPPPPTACPLTQGFWKNHPSQWKVTTLTIGGIAYNKTQLLSIFNTSPGGDAKIILAHQLIAAMLNVANGAASTPLIAQGNALLNGINLLTGPVIDPSSPLGTQMTNVSNQLDTYNSNENCRL